MNARLIWKDLFYEWSIENSRKKETIWAGLGEAGGGLDLIRELAAFVV